MNRGDLNLLVRRSSLARGLSQMILDLKHQPSDLRPFVSQNQTDFEVGFILQEGIFWDNDSVGFSGV